MLARARTIAVLGIKPESRRQLDAHQIPLYLQSVGYAIVPVPVRYPEAGSILGAAVVRDVREARADILNVFCKPRDLLPRVDAIIALGPRVVWFQSGLLELDAAVRLVDAGIAIAEDCIGCRRASMSPSTMPLHGQIAVPR